jgi:uncharacterized integral membrane protein
MQFDDKSPPVTTSKAKRDLGSAWIAAIIAALIYGIPFVLLNTHDININFVIFSADVSLIFALLIMVALGFVLGFVVSHLRERKKTG